MRRARQSVRNGVAGAVATLRCACFVHDGARPLVRADDVRAGMRAVSRRSRGGAGVAGRRHDQTRRRRNDDSCAKRSTRGELWAAQTPQFAMRRDLRARARAGAAERHRSDRRRRAARAIGIEVVVVPSVAGELQSDASPKTWCARKRFCASGWSTRRPKKKCCSSRSSRDDALGGSDSQRSWNRAAARIDAVERDLPARRRGARVRPHPNALRGFASRFEAFADGTATFTTRFSHYAGRDESASARA